MYARSILLSKLFILLSIAPLWAQYSFEKTLGGSEDDQPYGMLQLTNGNFIVYGYSYSQNVQGNNYIACVDGSGKLLWEKQATNRYGEVNHSCHETSEGNILLTGNATYKGGSPYLALLNQSGDLLYDTILSLQQPGEMGGIFKAVYNDEKKEIISIGGGAVYMTSGLLFHRCTYSGKQLAYKIIPFEDLNSPIRSIQKVKGKDEYLLFLSNKVMKFDNNGNVLENLQWAVDTTEKNDVEIFDIVQHENGTFTCLVHRWVVDIGGYYLQHNDSSGKFIRYSTRITNGSGIYVYRTLTRTKEKGFFAAGNNFTLIDSNWHIKWQKNAKLLEDADYVNIGQAADGGFYGSIVDWRKNDINDRDIYIYKTTIDGIMNGLGDAAYERLKVQVMPNPSNGLFSISGAFKEAQVSVSNLLGQQLMQITLLTGETLDASQLQPGLYLLSITSGNASAVQRISIQK